jgi:hypothetical protein
MARRCERVAGRGGGVAIWELGQGLDHLWILGCSCFRVGHIASYLPLERAKVLATGALPNAKYWSSGYKRAKNRIVKDQAKSWAFTVITGLFTALPLLCHLHSRISLYHPYDIKIIKRSALYLLSMSSVLIFGRMV